VSDVACFVNGLLFLEGADSAALFQSRYASAAKDRDLETLMPFYQVLMALRRGLTASEAAVEATLPDDMREDMRNAAQSHFALAVQVVRSMTRPIAVSVPQQQAAHV